jgi:hypothetical protein
MAHFEYELDEFQPWPGMSVYVYGVAVITYQWEGRDRDTGECAGPYDIEVEAIEIYGDSVKDKNHALNRTHPLYEAIEHQLGQSRHVVSACIEDWES